MHDLDQPCFAESLLEKLIPALIRSGSVSPETILALADQIDHEAQGVCIEDEERLAEMSSFLRNAVVEAVGPSLSEHQAERRRANIHAIDGGARP